MNNDWLDKRVRIVNVDGMVWHGLPIKTGHPEHVDKEGTIVEVDESGIPTIRLDDGAIVEGCECWWVPVGWLLEEG
jgi:hypothetical protein